ncbi:MAG TPA: type 2 lanthipeptide synthetase LanM [Gemmatimonadaceae bacterium]|nr:type 2 lanthipeptide synthetase LanM [Gemmatimonadaceae bacterium]
MRATGNARVPLPTDTVAGRSIDGARDGARGNAHDPDCGADAMRALVIEIVERASTFRERLTCAYQPLAAPASERTNESIEAWCASAAKGDARTFARRLELDGLDLPGAERAVGPVRIATTGVLPEWARLLEHYIDALQQREEEPEGNGDAIPFVELFAPLARLLERELESIAPHSPRQLSRTARRGLRASLLKRLARSAAPVLYEQFERGRAKCRANPKNIPENEAPGHSPSSGLYRDYVRGMLDGGMVDLFRELPVLARIMTTTALLWRDASVELLAHLREDRALIANFFGGGIELGELVAIEAGMSDPHAGGRTVHVLTFASGLRLVYKPRCLGIDAAFGELLSWLALRGAPLPPPGAPTFAARVLDRGSHGWAEYVERRECVDASAVRRYYQNAGALLALLYSLGSMDVHYENIVASGERPVIVDLETVLQPEVARSDPPLDRARNFGARRLYDDSVLRSGMLPAWQSSVEDAAYDIGGLSASADQTTPFTASHWRSINSDAMRLEHVRATIGAHPNFPVLGGHAIPPTEHVSDIVLGFRRTYEWLASHRDTLLAPDGPVARLAHERVRFIARPSSVYDHVLRRSLRREALHDGAARGIELELLARGLLPLPPTFWPLLVEEERALEQLDVPIFTLRGDATKLTLGERSISVSRSGLDVARARIETLGPADLEQQLHIIRASFALRYFDEPASRPHHGEPAIHDGEALDAPPLSRGDIIAAALEIAAELRRTTLVDCRGDVTWITTEPISRSGHHRLQATGYGLYDGLAGIALFLAAAARCGGDERSRALAHRALGPIRERLRVSSPTYVDEYGVGGACGAAAAIYSLLRSGTLLNDDTIVDDALLAARQLTPASIARDTRADVLYGSAGTILALLALHRARSSDQLLDLAHECGKRLLALRRPIRTSCGASHHVWLTVDGCVRTGFAHGAAGIALALLRLHAATGITRYLEAALDAVRHEDSLLYGCRSGRPLPPDAETATNVKSVPSGTATNWCHGAAGAGLARLACTAGSHATELRVSAERAIAAIVSDADNVTASLDCACCGASGEIELLLTGGLRWGDSSLLDAAHERASRLVRRSRAVRGWRLSKSPGAQVHDPALYRGTSGIGYGLLRLCHPEMLPSFLSWQ